jgi:hypothetical protein
MHNLNRLEAYFIKPTTTHFRDIFLSSFDSGVWLTLTAVYVIQVLTIRVFFRMAPRFINSGDDDDDEGNRNLYNESWIWAVGAVTQQGQLSSTSTNDVDWRFVINSLLII